MFADASLTLNLAKCEFAKATITYLGKKVVQGQVRPVDAKKITISEFPVPATKRELRCFLALACYYRGFCRNFASIVSPLTDLLSPTKDLVWDAKCELPFQTPEMSAVLGLQLRLSWMVHSDDVLFLQTDIN